MFEFLLKLILLVSKLLFPVLFFIAFNKKGVISLPEIPFELAAFRAFIIATSISASITVYTCYFQFIFLIK